MIKPLSIIVPIMLASTGVAIAEPQGGFPAQRERATQAASPGQPRADGAKKDEVQRRQEEVMRRDKAITSSICKGC